MELISCFVITYRVPPAHAGVNKCCPPNTQKALLIIIGTRFEGGLFQAYKHNPDGTCGSGAAGFFGGGVPLHKAMVVCCLLQVHQA